MASKLYPLVYKPGIKRDGTAFQSEYCTDGSWVRFQRGTVRKMGGMLSLNTSFPQGEVDPITVRNIPNIAVVSATGVNSYGYIATSSKKTSVVYKVTYDKNFFLIAAPNLVTPDGGQETNLIWQFETIVRETPPAIPGGTSVKARNIIAFAAPNAILLEQAKSPGIIYNGAIDSDDPLTVNTQSRNSAGNDVKTLDPRGNGGICTGYNASTPYLFNYGTEGYVGYSRTSDPLDFRPGEGSGELTISDDKVIYGRPMRGGSNSPTLLFWTLSSVVRVTNVGEQEVAFNSDIITRSSSILSSRCVVEYDGLFFWLGTDRFFVYNGVVKVVKNPINSNFFFDNIDMNYRQKVFGVRNARYGEIWWFFPTKDQGQIVRNTMALIYNVEENSWYDTEISRDCGMFFDEKGYLCTLGRALENADNASYLWKHETGVTQEWYPAFLGGIQTSTPISARFTTPVFSWAAFNPLKQQTGEDRWTDLRRIEPDFVTDNNTDIINVFVNTKEYAQSANVQSVPFSFTGSTEKIDMNIQGRHMTLEFTSDKNFEIGHLMMLLAIGDGQ